MADGTKESLRILKPGLSDSDDDSHWALDDPDGAPDTDWERVPISTPEDAGERSTDFYPSALGGASSRFAESSVAHTSTVGGLVSSAAASVTSLWRAATWKS